MLWNTKKKESLIPTLASLEEAQTDGTKELSKEELEPVLLKSIKERAIKDGRVFNSDAEANMWSKKKLTKILDKEYMKGSYLKCSVCHKEHSDKTTGPLHNYNGTYVHKNCI